MTTGTLRESASSASRQSPGNWATRCFFEIEEICFLYENYRDCEAFDQDLATFQFRECDEFNKASILREESRDPFFLHSCSNEHEA